jgi:hypothetical protein
MKNFHGPGSTLSNADAAQLFRQVFWLVDRSTYRAFPSRFSETVAIAVFVPTHSGGTATVSYRLPY